MFLCLFVFAVTYGLMDKGKKKKTNALLNLIHPTYLRSQCSNLQNHPFKLRGKCIVVSSDVTLFC